MKLSNIFIISEGEPFRGVFTTHLYRRGDPSVNVRVVYMTTHDTLITSFHITYDYFNLIFPFITFIRPNDIVTLKLDVDVDKSFRAIMNGVIEQI